eukprot:306906-Chlamydomonas_euryale.AAC.1
MRRATVGDPVGAAGRGRLCDGRGGPPRVAGRRGEAAASTAAASRMWAGRRVCIMCWSGGLGMGRAGVSVCLSSRGCRVACEHVSVCVFACERVSVCVLLASV